MTRFNLVWMDMTTGETYVMDDYGTLVPVDLNGAAIYHPCRQEY